MIAKPKKEVFVLQFAIGKFDMVVFSPDKVSCEIFEIKHSEEISEIQYRHLIDKDKCLQTDYRYGAITNKTVLYRGMDSGVNGIKYQNVEKYLVCLH